MFSYKKARTTLLCASLFSTLHLLSISDAGKKLFEIIKTKDIETLSTLLSSDEYKNAINEKNALGNTPLHEAAKLSKTDPKMIPMVTLFLDNGANPLIKNINGQYASAFTLLDSDIYKTLKSREREAFEKLTKKAHDYNWNTLTLSAFAEDFLLSEPEFGSGASSRSLEQAGKEKIIQAVVASSALIKLFALFNTEIKPMVIGKTLCSPEGKIVAIGDQHGSAHGLVRTLIRLKKMGFIGNDFKLSTNNYLLFLGDYSDRGSHSIEVWTLIMLLKIKNPNNVILILGNHDNSGVASKEGTFDAEIRAKYPTTADEIIANRDKAFEKLSKAAFIGVNNSYIFACHGWLPFYASQADKDNLKKILSGCIDSNATDCEELNTIPGLLMGRFKERPAGNDPLISMTDFTPNYLLSISRPTCTIISLFCGHKHFEAPISVINNALTDWVQLKEPVKVIEHSAYVFTSAPEMGATKPTSGGFGLVTLHSDPAKWLLTPYEDVTSIKGTDIKFTHLNANGTFSYENGPQSKDAFQDALH